MSEQASRYSSRPTALVIARRSGESVTIGEGIESITVTPYACTPGRVKLRIVAPADMQILRDDAGNRTPRTPRPGPVTPAV